MVPSEETYVELEATKPCNEPMSFRTTQITRGSGTGNSSRDDARLQRLGKRPQLNRSFGFMSILGFSCSALLSWEGVLVNSVTALLNGGPAGVIWSFLVNWLGTISVYAALGELASIAPTAAGQCKTSWFIYQASYSIASCSKLVQTLTSVHSCQTIGSLCLHPNPADLFWPISPPG